MSNELNKKYLFISLGLHVGILFSMAFIIHSNRINKTFLVFGAHSQKPSHAFLKLNNHRRTAIPFMTEGKRKGGKGKKGSGKKTTSKQQHTQKLGTGKKNKFCEKAVSKPHQKQAKIVQKKEPKGNIPQLLKKNNNQILEQPATEVTQGSGVKMIDKKERDAKIKKLKKLQKRIQELDKILALQKKEEDRRLQVARELEKRLHEKSKTPTKIKPQKAEEQEEKVVARQVEESKNEEISENSAQDLDDPITAESSSLNEDDNEDDSELLEFNLVGESDAELRIYYQSIQKEVSRLWHPPLGVPKGTTCRIMFVVNRNGSVDKCEFVTRSKMLIYDLSIWRVAKNFQFDPCLWGKRFTIDFCQ